MFFPQIPVDFQSISADILSFSVSLGQELGNGRNTVSRILFRKRELTEPHWFWGQTQWVLRKTWRACFDRQIAGWGELTELSPRNSVAKKPSVFLKPYSPKPYFDTEYDRAKVPPYNGDDPRPPLAVLKLSCFPPLLSKVQDMGTQGVRARYDAELPPIIAIVRYPGRPVILGPRVP